MTRGAKITLVVFVILFGLAALAGASWFIFKDERASAAINFINQGDKHLTEKNYALALICYKKAALLTPRSYAPFFKQGILAKTTGHYNEALEFLLKATNLGPKEAAAYLTLGETYLSIENLSQAKAIFTQAAGLQPENENIAFLLFQIALKENDFEEAEKQLIEAEERSRDSRYLVYRALVKSLSDPSESEELIADINQTINLNGLELADFYHIFQKMKEIENPVSRELMAYQTFIQIGEVDFGLGGIEKISRDNPEMRDAWVFLAYGYLMKNESEKSKEALDKAVKLDPIYPLNYYLLSKYYEQINNSAQAEKNLQKARELGFDEENPLLVESK